MKIRRYWLCNAEDGMDCGFYFETKNARDEYIADNGGIDNFIVWDEVMTFDIY